jgi:hypothetical protein
MPRGPTGRSKALRGRRKVQFAPRAPQGGTIVSPSVAEAASFLLHDSGKALHPAWIRSGWQAVLDLPRR